MRQPQSATGMSAPIEPSPKSCIRMSATMAPGQPMRLWTGASVADLLMQLLGLGAIAALLPLAQWGWRLMKAGELGRWQLRLALWVIASAAATAFASALPATDR